MDLACGSVHKHIKRELDQYSPIRTSRSVNKIYVISCCNLIFSCHRGSYCMGSSKPNCSATNVEQPEVDELLKNIDPRMVELIKNEVKIRNVW